MVPDNDVSQDKREGVPMFDQVDPKSWKHKMLLYLMRKQRAHIGLQARPTIANGPANTIQARTLHFTKLLSDWWIAQDKGLSYTMMACEDDPDADTVAKTYFALKTDANPPEDALLTELMDALETRFLGDQQVRVESLQGQYNSFGIESSVEKVPAAIDRFKLIIQKLTQLGAAPTDGSKIEKLKSSLKTQKRFETLSVILAMKPTGTTFEELCEACKAYDRAIMDLPSHSVNSLSTGKKKYTPEEKHAYAKKMAKDRQQKFKARRQQKDDNGGKSKVKNKNSHIECHNCGIMGHYKNQCPHQEQEEQEEHHQKAGKKRTQYERDSNSPRIKYEKKKQKSIKNLRTGSAGKALDWSRRGVMDEDDEAKDGYESNMISAGGAESDSEDDMPSMVRDDSDSDNDDDDPTPIRMSMTRNHQGNLPVRNGYYQFPLYQETPLDRRTRIFNEEQRARDDVAASESSTMVNGSTPDDPDGDSKMSSEDKSDSEDDVQSIFMTIAAASTAAKETIYLDSCASKGLLIVRDSNVLDDMDSTIGVINLTKKGSSMTTQGSGSKGSWTGITVCKDSVKNICAVDRLKTAGYGLVQLEEDHIVDLQTRESVLKCMHKNGMPYVLLSDLLSLPDNSC
jgi:hypothetical protein